MRYGDNGPVIWLFIKSESDKMQADADKERLEILGKLSNSTIGANTEAKEKQVKPSKRKIFKIL